MKLGSPSSLTPKMSSRVMAFATMMMATMTSMVTQFSLDERDGLREIACAPHSWLSESAQQHGLRPRRINLQNGYDLYRSSTWQTLKELRKVKRPKRLWLSLPCTRWCPWTAINYSTWERQQLLEFYRRRERRMLREAARFIEDAVQDDPSIEVYRVWPVWPHNYLACKQNPVVHIADTMAKFGFEWLPCRVDGCCYFMKDAPGDFLLKKWRIYTNSEQFHQAFKRKLCPQNHSESQSWSHRRC